MDELDLLREMIAEYAEIIRALLENPSDAQARRKARHLLGIPEPETVPTDDPQRKAREFTIGKNTILTLRSPTPQLGTGSRVRSYTHTPEHAARIMAATRSIPNAITYVISKNHIIIQSQTQEETA